MTSPGVEGGTVPSAAQTEVDAALAEVADLSDVPLAEHHTRLERAHEVLHGVLNRAREQG